MHFPIALLWFFFLVYFKAGWATDLSLPHSGYIPPGFPVGNSPLQGRTLVPEAWLHSRANNAIAGGVALRILPLGDSITWGYLSSDGNGYRLDLENDLSGNPVDYIGSQTSGNMPDNHNEGHPGATIDQILDFSSASLPERPNVVLLHAGTNDLNDNPPVDPGGAPERLDNLIDKIISSCPDAAVLVAQIVPNGNAAVNALVQTFNAAIPGIVKTRADAGNHVLVVDMYSALTTADLTDGLHPNDGGYAKMANVWYASLVNAGSMGWIQPPVDVTSIDGGACDGDPIWYPQGTIATGIGTQNMTFTSIWYPQGEVGTGVGSGLQVRFGDIDGDGRDDYLFVHSNGSVDLYWNTKGSDGSIVWMPKGQIASGIGKDGAGVMFADINGDGRDDYLWISDTGGVEAYINTPGASPTVPVWIPWGNIIDSSSSLRGNIRFGDVDGDGYADWMQVNADGSISCALNRPVAGGVSRFDSIGLISTGIQEDGAGVHIADINGDGRADYLWLDTKGATTLYLNAQSPQDGQPAWFPQGVISTGVGANRNNVTFADLNGDGKADYVTVNASTGAISVWLNGGSGGAFETGQGVMFADLNGDGRDEYLFVDEDGSLTAYLNLGGSSPGQPGWLPQGVIATGVGAKRHQVHLADINGDGRVEYLVVDDKTGAVTSWANEGSAQGNDGPDAGKIVWVPQGTIATGIGDGKGVRFADINGDGRADYIWLAEDGQATLYINGGGSDPQHPIWIEQDVIATGVGAVREDVVFADINGDGRDDYLWLNRLDGSIQAWFNGGWLGPKDVIWNPQGTIATGVGASGQSIVFGDLNGDGRDEYLEVTPSNGAIKAWYNGCNAPAP
ncbi:hypothetical protein B7463_g2678, partial [Scytalidium lignicola]